jgi:hypothetical protein
MLACFFSYVKKVEEFLCDPGTAHPLYNAVALPECQHLFSRASIMPHIGEHHQCPVCFAPATVEDIRPVDEILQKILNKLKVFPRVYPLHTSPYESTL